MFDSKHQQVTYGEIEQLTHDVDTSGYAIAVSVDPTRQPHKPPPYYVAYDPWWWLKNSPVEGIQQLIREEGEAAQITTLIDASQAITSPRARAQVQRRLYEALVAVAHEQLKQEAPVTERELATH